MTNQPFFLDNFYFYKTLNYCTIVRQNSEQKYIFCYTRIFPPLFWDIFLKSVSSSDKAHE